jgi:hypothetical protein
MKKTLKQHPQYKLKYGSIEAEQELAKDGMIM